MDYDYGEKLLTKPAINSLTDRKATERVTALVYRVVK